MENQANIMLLTIENYIKSLKQIESQRSSRSESLDDLITRAKDKVLNDLRKEPREQWRLKLSFAKNYVDELFISVLSAGLCGVKMHLTTKRKIIFGWGFLSLITEVGLSWDPILDVPVIRGSTVKGIVRDHFSIVAGSNQARQMEAEIFGDKTRVGKVIFFDAYPVEAVNPLLSPDVITPHYMSSVKNEYEVRPNPVKFLAVNEGVTFAAVFAFRKGELGEEARRNLLKAVLLSAKTGWGRRTTRGYGELEVKVGETRFSCP